MMDIAYSPCPNDTYIFDAWVHKKIPSTITPQPTLADIQQLNLWAYAGRYPVTKVSVFCLANICAEYQMLPTGAAIGHFGPKLVAKSPYSLGDIKKMKIAIPGFDTTAYLLLRALFGNPGACIACRYEEIVPLILRGEVDAGLIIHETRFTFTRFGLIELADLGSLYTSETGHLVPLGVVVCKRTLPDQQRIQVADALKQSALFAQNDPTSSQEYVLTHAQEKEQAVIDAHIKAYVTDETIQVSDRGIQAIHSLFERGIDQGLLSKKSLGFL